MAESLIAMQGAEFVKKILAGERDFSRIDLEEGFDLCGHEDYDTLLKYLRESNLKSNPLNIERARLRHLDADELYLPFVRANGASLKHAALMSVNLEHAQLEGADFRYARLARANLTGANLKGADFRLADLNLALLAKSVLTGADFEAADLEYTSMQGSDARGIKNLQWARYLKTVNFQHVEITHAERDIIRNALWAEDGKKQRVFGGSG